MEIDLCVWDVVWVWKKGSWLGRGRGSVFVVELGSGTASLPRSSSEGAAGLFTAAHYLDGQHSPLQRGHSICLRHSRYWNGMEEFQ